MQTITNVDEALENMALSYIADGNEKGCKFFGKHFGISSKLNIELLYDPAISLLGICARELKTLST